MTKKTLTTRRSLQVRTQVRAGSFNAGNAVSSLRLTSPKGNWGNAGNAGN